MGDVINQDILPENVQRGEAPALCVTDVINQAILPETVQNRTWMTKKFLCRGGGQIRSEILARKESSKILGTGNMVMEVVSNATNATDTDTLLSVVKMILSKTGATDVLVLVTLQGIA